MTLPCMDPMTASVTSFYDALYAPPLLMRLRHAYRPAGQAFEQACAAALPADARGEPLLQCAAAVWGSEQVFAWIETTYPPVGFNMAMGAAPAAASSSSAAAASGSPAAAAAGVPASSQQPQPQPAQPLPLAQQLQPARWVAAAGSVRPSRAAAVASIARAAAASEGEGRASRDDEAASDDDDAGKDDSDEGASDGERPSKRGRASSSARGRGRGRGRGRASINAPVVSAGWCYNPHAKPSDNAASLRALFFRPALTGSALAAATATLSAHIIASQQHARRAIGRFVAARPLALEYRAHALPGCDGWLRSLVLATPTGAADLARLEARDFETLRSQSDREADRITR